MYFKQIELSGFKSFADRTQVRLEQGITAIVGPNGCGKSNILDAMRWSLGEQNARELRGLHMLDVIFNGSENRQPMGMAEVSITFDNSESKLPVDFAEVSVTRRIYRSGESEYFINKAPCRLRDINEMFMDTGIGTSAYSLIGQGKIDLVLSSKPDDRRFLFEEAAGIIKYKARKKVAIRKLDAAEQNLLRLNDIIAEVQRQMRSLKRQVNAAIRYREMKEALRDLEIRSLYLKYFVLKEQVHQLREQFATAQDAYEKAMTETTELEARSEELALQRIEVERVLSERRETVHQIDAEMEKIERQVALLRQQIAFSKEQQQQAVDEHAALLERAASIQAQLAQTGESTVELQAELESCRAAIEAKQDEHDAKRQQLTESEERLEAVRARTVETMNSRAKANTELETIAVNLRNVEDLLKTLSEQQHVQAERHRAFSEKLAEAREKETATLEALEAVVDQKTRFSEDHAARTRTLRELQDEWQTLRETKSSQEARLHSLRELRDSYEGFAVGVRAIMMAKQRNMTEVRGVIGPAGDLLSTEKAYERAVEAALGGNVNNIVVDRADAAKSAIQFLKQHRAGRVTFLPLDTIRSGSHDDIDSIKGKPGVIGPAINYVTFDGPIRKAVEYLLHNVVIVETLDDAIRIARSENRYPRMVTLDGEIVSPAGAVTGGQTQTESRGLLGRSAEIAELEEKVARLTAKTAEMAAQAETLNREIQALTQRIKELEAPEKSLRAELNELGMSIARTTTELGSVTRATEQFKKEVQAREAERQRLDERRKNAFDKATTMADDDATLQRTQAEAQEMASAARQALNACAAELADLRVRLAEITQRAEEAGRNLSREQIEHEETLRNAERRIEQAAQLKENEAALETEIETGLEQAKVLSGDREKAHELVVETQNEQHTFLDETDALTKTLRDLHERARASQSEVHRLEMALRHDEDQINFLEERVLAEYHVALDSLDKEKIGTDEYDDDAREAMVAELREKLDRLGQVNLMAIEEYEALEKRNDFLVTQEADLRQAKDTLLGIVARIDTTIKEMFLETFGKVAENFRVFFRRLFNGGQARVYLLDENDPLESGIEIEARPPGKKPQSISLLSGGEQAMTAISLLFSIFKARPCPFCVLDEVDAPLDDANIGRFLDMVQEFTDESQFIIITHSKPTMARANVLYGVTMQERGVSQLVSVKFEEAPARKPKAEPPPEEDEKDGEEAEPEEENSVA